MPHRFVARRDSLVGLVAQSFVFLLLMPIACGDFLELAPEEGAGPPHGPTARFDPSAADLPFPNVLLFAGSADGTVAIDGDPDDDNDPRHALSALDGFSVTSPWIVRFDDDIDGRSVAPGKNVRAFSVEISPLALTVSSVIAELIPGRDYVPVVGDDDRSIAIVPLRPFPDGGGLLVVVTRTVRGANALPIEPSNPFLIATAETSLIDDNGASTRRYLNDDSANKLEPVRRLFRSGVDAVRAHGIERDDIAILTYAQTLSAGFMFDDAAAVVDDELKRGLLDDDLVVHPAAVFTTAALNVDGEPPRFAGTAAIFAAALRLPTFVDDDNPNDTVRGLNGFPITRARPTLVPQGEHHVPVLISLPVGAASAVPCVVFQHGITGDRTQVLALVEAMAAAGHAVVAIDLPRHGLVDDEPHTFGALVPLLSAHGANSIYDQSPVFADVGVVERAPDVDVFNNETGVVGGDGRIDRSGAHFANLGRLLSVRDNLIVAVADHQRLAARLSRGVDLDGDGNLDIAPGAPFFVGHSLGAMVGASLSSTTNAYRGFVLSHGGGRLGSVFVNSPTFGPRVKDALRTNGIEPGSAAFAEFVVVSQTVLDAVDPVAFLHRDERPVLSFVLVGGDGTLDDQVVPPVIDGDPLGGGIPLARQMGLVTVSGGTMSDDAIRALVPVQRGSHASLLDPSADVDATVFLQSTTASFIASGGTFLDVQGTTVVADAP